MGTFTRDGDCLIWRENQHKLWIYPYGPNAFRVQANLAGKPLDLPQALLPSKSAAEIETIIEIGAEQATIRNGAMQADVERNGRLTYRNAISGEILLAERDWTYFAPTSRDFRHKNGRLFRLEAWFKAQPGERFYGLGQHQHGHLDQKGCVIELQQRNTEVSIPFLVSNRKYGLLWNNPGVGRVELGNNATRWVADGAQQLDYYIVCGANYADILRAYADVTGYAPVIPEWALGFWQCKLRYETQEELLNVAREYKKRGLPLAIIVADFFHWHHMGDWKFHPRDWPDPKAMVQELESMGVKLMVSIWPTVVPISENYQTMRERGLLVNNEYGVDAQHVFIDHDVNGPAYFAYYDATNPEGRQFIWDTVKKNYYDQGVKLWWLDNDEPDINPWDPENLRFYIGNGLEVANLYPLLHQQAFYDGMKSVGETEIITLSRSGWAGSQRFSSIIWSGDVASTFEALQAQVRAGLNMAMSGIPWWTTDIGGFHGGDVRTPEFRELIVRWFQFGVFSPICRLHGHRLPVRSPFPDSGADNEIWSFGDDVYAILRDLLFLRERLRPYIYEQMKVASETGVPPMRPLFFDFPNDPDCETVDDQFLLGSDILVAPVMTYGARERRVYLPTGTAWTDAWTGMTWEGGQTINAVAPIERVPLYVRAGKQLPIVK